MARTSLQAAYDQARRWIESNDSERAIGLAQHILAQYPDNLEAYRILGEAYLASRQLDRAQEAFEHVLRADPENIPAHVGLGITFERQGRLDRAVPEFEQAWEIKPDMAELRSQLLRLYTDAWGSENAQLRLSRAGLARLYAKGHMLPQAIAEFRQVINDQPARYDAKVALAEALWRDGQEDEAVSLSRAILAERPETLKANLLLGYIELASGNPSGQAAWDAAARRDPYQTVARAMFDTLPQPNAEEPAIEEWDEAAWREQQLRDQEELAAATRPMPVAAVSAAPTEPALEEDFLGASWLDTPVTPPPPPAPAPARAAVDMDDFLAGLLAISPSGTEDAQAPAEAVADDLELDIEPFAFDTETGLPAEPAPSASTRQPAPEPTPASEEPEMMPFSLADLGLSEDEIAGLGTLDATTEAAAQTPSMQPERPWVEASSYKRAEPPQPIADEPELTPFSLADLGLSEDEISGLDALGATDATTQKLPVEPELPAAPATPAREEPELTPFSLADLGLSEDEIAGLDALGSADTTPEQPSVPARPQPAARPSEPDEPDLAPFSLADLGLSEDEIASLDALGSIDTAPEQPSAPATPLSSEPDEPELTPFSLADLGLSEDEIASLDMLQPDAGSHSSQRQSPTTDQQDIGELPLDLRPFSLDELDLSAPDDAGTSGSSLPPSLQPFSLDEPSEPPSAARTPPRSFTNNTERFDIPELEDDPSTQTGGYSWQEPPQRIKPEFSNPKKETPSAEELSIFAKLKQRKQQEPAPADEPPLTNEIDNDPRLFSMDDVPLRDEAALAAAASPAAQTPVAEPEPPAPPVEAESIEEALSSGQIKPFSFADLGLSEEELSALGLAEPAAEPPAPPETPAFEASAPEVPHAGHTHAAPIESESLDEAIASGEVQPFSFADLGLSDEEIAALGLDTGATSGQIEQSQPAVSPEPAEPTSAPNEEPDDIAPFSLDLDEALPDNNVTFPPSQTNARSTPAFPPGPTATPEDEALLTTDLKPFSLSDLGLSDEEISALGLGSLPEQDEPSRTGLGITEEELRGLDLGDLNWQTPEPAELPDMPAVSAEETPTGDQVVERLIALGRAQGYVDIADIIAGVENPEAEEDRIEEIGRLLHEARIEIRDGDEVIDMEADYDEFAADAEPVAPAFETPSPVQDEEPPLTPFSLSELGLSEEEIAALGLGDATPATPAEPEPATRDEEPPLTPFSLSELGLSEEEIASLGLGDTTAPAQEPAAFDLDEADAFSLDDLNIAEPGEEQVEQAAPQEAAAREEEPPLTPFSLSDLGLSEEEIASLGLGEPSAPAAEPEPEPFSLEALGLSESLTDSLDLEPPSAPEPAAVEPVYQAPASPPVPPTPAPPAQAQTPPAFVPPSPVPPTPAPVQQAPVSSAPTAPPAAPRPQPAAASGNFPPIVQAYLQRLDAEPQNYGMRLAVARAIGQTGMTELAVQQYRHLIRQSVMLDQVVEDLRDLIDDTDDRQALQRLHRVLGDAYSKQGLLDEAIAEYSWSSSH